MRKTSAMLLTSALLFGAISPALAEKVNSTNEVQQMQPNFLTLTGTVPELTDREQGWKYGLIESDNPFAISVSADTKVVDRAGNDVTLKEGMPFTAYVNTNKPMILIYPPQYTPELIVVETEVDGQVAVGQFDAKFSNAQLKLNISKKTTIEDLAGHTLTKTDIINKDVVVFYQASTRSIPAQTTPSRIIVLTTPQTEVEQIILLDQHTKNDVTMVPLRQIAETLGWTVQSTGKGAILTKGNASYTITRGEKSYGYNRSLRTFEEAPALLEANKTYVPLSFIEQLY